MKLDKELYQRSFSRLKASPELRKELLAMTEKTDKTRKPKRFILRRLAVAAAVMALAAALAMGANAATGGELFQATIGKLVLSFELNDGSTARMYQAESEDGKVTFLIEDEGTQIPKKENGDGTYSFEVPSQPSEDTEGQFYKAYEVETDENGNVVNAHEGLEPEN